jgi:hypothetical protein
MSARTSIGPQSGHPEPEIEHLSRQLSAWPNVLPREQSPVLASQGGSLSSFLRLVLDGPKSINQDALSRSSSREAQLENADSGSAGLAKRLAN